MAASADKVQYILQTLLEDSLGLVKRGIFSQVELKDMMYRRQKCQNTMLKKSYRVTDYLGAIEYEYQLERQRRLRMDQLAKVEDGETNHAFRKESSSDFVIVKRIIKLWDRTMHKYKFKLHLWKQYLHFCITIGSKKHFYKTLTKALRFLPFETDLWKIGVQYQKQVGHNLWKARKILIKGMKMVSSGNKNIDLGHYMIRFQVDFLKSLLQRREIISKGEEGMKFIVEGEEEDSNSQKEGREAMDNINLQQYDQMLWIIIQQILQKNQNQQVQSLKFSNIKKNLQRLINDLIQQNSNNIVKEVLLKSLSQLNKYILVEDEIKVEAELNFQEKQEYICEEVNDLNILATAEGNINIQLANKLIKERCLNPQGLIEIYENMLDINYSQTLEYMINHKSFRYPSSIIHLILTRFYEEKLENKEIVVKFLNQQIDRLEAKDFRQNINLLKQVVKFNSNQNRLQSTSKIIRSLSIAFKGDNIFLEICNKISNSF